MSDTNDSKPTDWNTWNQFNENLVAEFRANNGKVSGMFAEMPLILITHTGAKSGQKRCSPLVYTKDGDRIVIIASKGGAPKHPHWYLNMLADPKVTVELPGEKFEARAVVVSGDERARLYRAQADAMPNFDEYAAKTDREIPVVVLERV